MRRAFIDSFRFQGRINRLGFWRWQLALGMIGTGIWVAMILLAMGGVAWAAFALIALLIAFAYAAIGVGVRRLHDRGKSGWWLVLFQGLPMALAALPVLGDQYLGDDRVFVALSITSLTGLVFSIWGWIELGVLRGRSIENRFGPRPG